LRVHFQKHLEDQNEFIHFANVGFNTAIKKGLAPFDQRSQESRRKAKVILGHKVNFETKDLVVGNSVEELVIFRNPVDWERSRFNQHANRLKKHQNFDLNFDHWLTEVNKTHSQFDWFLSNYLKLGAEVRKMNPKSKESLLFDTLSNFHHVLFIENFQHKLKRIFSELQIPENPSKVNAVGKDKNNFFDNTTSNQHQLETLCQNEMAIYERLKDRFL
jgi:hypothetical protein